MGRKLYSGLTSGVKGQTSIENFELLEKLKSQAAPGNISYMKEDERFNVNISKRSDIDPNGIFDVIAHGNANVIEINVNGRKHEVSWRCLANIIKRKPKLQGLTIRLLSCSTGSTDNGFAQNLANKLNVKVIAPTKYLWAFPDGKYFVSGGKINKFGILVPINNNKGEFKTFYPKKEWKK